MGPLAISHAVLSLLGLITSGAAYYLPCTTTIADVRRDQSVGQRSPLTYIAAIVSCVLWGIYGVWPKDSDLIALINIFGVATQCYCLYQFLYYSEDEDRHYWGVYLATGLLSLLGIIFYYLSDVNKNLTFFSWACAFARALPAIGPFVKLRTVIRLKSMSAMPSVNMSRISLANAMVWIGVSCTGTEFDGVIFYPSLVALASAAVLIGMHIIYSARQKDDLRRRLLREE